MSGGFGSGPFGVLGAAGPPTGAAGGSLAGTYPNPSIASSVSLPGSPTTTTQAVGDNTTKVATTAYVTTGIANAVAGVNPAVAVQAATTKAADTSGMTYANGVAGVGATLTGTVNTAVTIDGYTFTAVGQRLLVKNDTQSPSGAFNGIYTLTQLQTALLAPVFTRASDYNTPASMNNTGAIPVVSGTVNTTTQWVMTAQVVTVGTTPLTFAQFAANPATPWKSPYLPTGYIAESTPRGIAALVNSQLIATGTLMLAAIALPAGVVTDISWWSGTTGFTRGTNADSHLSFYLCDSSYKILAATADDTSTAWTANHEFKAALTAPYTITTPGLYYVGILVAQGTGGSPAVPSQLVCTMNTANIGEGYSPALCFNTTSTGQTTPVAVSTVLAYGAGQTSVPYALAS